MDMNRRGLLKALGLATAAALPQSIAGASPPKPQVQPIVQEFLRIGPNEKVVAEVGGFAYWTFTTENAKTGERRVYHVKNPIHRERQTLEMNTRWRIQEAESRIERLRMGACTRYDFWTPEEEIERLTAEIAQYREILASLKINGKGE